jgi:hypothetical protein
VVVEGDRIYRPTPDGDYMMIVETVGRGTYEGIEAFIFSGDVYKLTGEGAGSQPAFLGDIQARLAGTGGWKLPLDKNITEVVDLPRNRGGMHYEE